MSIWILTNTLQRVVPMESGSTSQSETCDFASKTLNPGNGVAYCFVTKARPDYINFVVIYTSLQTPLHS